MGRVKSLSRFSEQGHWLNEKIMKPYANNHGYLFVDLYASKRDGYKKERRYIHRLVAEYFIDNPYNYPQVDHIDTNPQNNMVTNLRWCTHSQNHLNPLTIKNKRAKQIGKKLPEEQRKKLCKSISVYKDGVYLHTFESYKDMDLHSKEIIGETLWNVYARDVVKGIREDYKGYVFKLT